MTPYFALASGFLTGKYRSETDLENQARAPRVQKYLNERGFKILAALDQISQAKNCSQASIALAWLMSRPIVTAPIVSATSVSQMKDISLASRLNLDADALKLLDEASDPGV